MPRQRYPLVAYQIIRCFMEDEINTGHAYAKELLNRLKEAGVQVIDPPRKVKPHGGQATGRNVR